MNVADGIHNFEPMHDDANEHAAVTKDMPNSKGVLELDSSSWGKLQQESSTKIEKIKYSTGVTGAYSAILAEKDESFENYGAVNEVCIESFADKKESMQVENVAQTYIVGHCCTWSGRPEGYFWDWETGSWCTSSRIQGTRSRRYWVWHC